MKRNESIQSCDAVENRPSLGQRRGLAKFLRGKIVLGLVFAMAGALVAPLGAGEGKYQAPKKIGPTSVTARIVFVDKTLRGLAVDIKGQILQIKVPSSMKITKGTKLITLEELVAGQEITITYQESSRGWQEVVALSVEGTAEKSEAAGAPKTGDNAPSTFPASPNPANLGGQVHSPNR